LASIQNNNQVHSIEQPITLIEGKKYALRYYYAIISGTVPTASECGIIAQVDNSVLDVNPLTTTQLGKYNQHEWIFTASATTELKITVECTNGGATVDVNLDDISIYPSSCLIVE
jgi:hypothetical protein